jgi:hypothetical protein
MWILKPSPICDVFFTMSPVFQILTLTKKFDTIVLQFRPNNWKQINKNWTVYQQ